MVSRRIAFLYCRLEKRCKFFIITEAFNLFGLYLYLFFSALYLQLRNLIYPRKILYSCVVYSLLTQVTSVVKNTVLKTAAISSQRPNLDFSGQGKGCLFYHKGQGENIGQGKIVFIIQKLGRIFSKTPYKLCFLCNVLSTVSGLASIHLHYMMQYFAKMCDRSIFVDICLYCRVLY